MDHRPNMKIYNTLTRKKQKLTEKKLGIYVCGPTVYDDPHIGHARSAYIFDVIVKYLKFKKLKIKFVRNVTDIDDKIIDRAKQDFQEGGLKGKAKEIADRYLKRYHEDMALLGLDRPDKEPKATETITDMVKFIEVLIKKDFAYAVSGNVYFDVRKYKRYGQLSGQSLDQMEEGARVSVDKNKKDPLDFALWKASKEDEPSWPSPWGEGRPGWHIECSVMSTKFLKNNFLIHGGGLDLVFPHHENEIAQTECAGKKSAKYWIHNGLLTINGQKMSKSLGNFISIKDFQSKFKDLDLLKLLFLSSHYRHPVDYTEEKIEQMKKNKERIVIFLQKVEEKVEVFNREFPPKYRNYEGPFCAVMDDDFNTPSALVILFKCVDDGNKILEKETLSDRDYRDLYDSRSFIKQVSSIFGLSFEYKPILDKDVLARIHERDEVRKNKDFKKADEIRNELLKQGVILEDTKEGTKWRKKA